MLAFRFTSDDSLIGRAIRFETFGKWQHVEARIPPGYFADYPKGGYLGAHLQGGFQLLDFDYAKPKRWVFATCEPPPEVLTNILSVAYNQIGAPYDLSAIFGFLFRRDWHQPGSWDCAEAWAAFGDFVGYPFLNTDKLNRVTPSDFAMSVRLKFQGENHAFQS